MPTFISGPENPNFSNLQMLSICTPSLLLKKLEGDQHFGDFAFSLKNGELSVLWALPPATIRQQGSVEILKFAKETFRLISDSPLNEPKSQILTQNKLRPGVERDCIKVAFPVSNPSAFTIAHEKVRDFQILTHEEFSASPISAPVILALQLFSSRITEAERTAYNILKGNPLEVLVGCLGSHAGHLAHKFLTEAGIPHIFHTGVDKFKMLQVGVGGESGSFEKAPFASPLKKVSSFINVVQLSSYLSAGKSAKSLLDIAQLSELVQKINELRHLKFSIEHKKVIHQILALMTYVPKDSQSIDFKQREPLLTRHIKHSAPFPQDAWKILCSGISIEVKEIIFGASGFQVG